MMILVLQYKHYLIAEATQIHHTMLRLRFKPNFTENQWPQSSAAKDQKLWKQFLSLTFKSPLPQDKCPTIPLIPYFAPFPWTAVPSPSRTPAGFWWSQPGLHGLAPMWGLSTTQVFHTLGTLQGGKGDGVVAWKSSMVRSSSQTDFGSWKPG